MLNFKTVSIKTKKIIIKQKPDLETIEKQAQIYKSQSKTKNLH